MTKYEEKLEKRVGELEDNINDLEVSEIYWKNVAEKLWDILDDIDTGSDRFKPRDEESYKKFYDYAMFRCKGRKVYLVSEDGYTLTPVDYPEESGGHNE